MAKIQRLKTIPFLSYVVQFIRQNLKPILAIILPLLILNSITLLTFIHFWPRIFGTNPYLFELLISIPFTALQFIVIWVWMRAPEVFFQGFGSIGKHDLLIEEWFGIFLILCGVFFGSFLLNWFVNQKLISYLFTVSFFEIDYQDPFSGWGKYLTVFIETSKLFVNFVVVPCFTLLAGLIIVFRSSFFKCQEIKHNLIPFLIGFALIQILVSLLFFVIRYASKSVILGGKNTFAYQVFYELTGYPAFITSAVLQTMITFLAIRLICKARLETPQEN